MAKNSTQENPALELARRLVKSKQARGDKGGVYFNRWGFDSENNLRPGTSSNIGLASGYMTSLIFDVESGEAYVILPNYHDDEEGPRGEDHRGGMTAYRIDISNVDDNLLGEAVEDFITGDGDGGGLLDMIKDDLSAKEIDSLLSRLSRQIRPEELVAGLTTGYAARETASTAAANAN